MSSIWSSDYFDYDYSYGYYNWWDTDYYDYDYDYDYWWLYVSIAPDDYCNKFYVDDYVHHTIESDGITIDAKDQYNLQVFLSVAIERLNLALQIFITKNQKTKNRQTILCFLNLPLTFNPPLTSSMQVSHGAEGLKLMENGWT
ncbi:uncharacterized protein LOC142349158 [Convolutriloba macropyga]|uniref:uncharacterized protein LOC142349158 n=1 Tax=Convolutriloba macropyga TaxID=536237 RepID=UPI003F5278C6